jgi:hypothetical protein
MTKNSAVLLVGSSFNPSCSWIDVPPAGSGAAPLLPGVLVVGRVLRGSRVPRQ